MLSSPGGFPYDGLYREVPLERGTFFTLIKAYERVGTCDFSNCKKTQKAAKKMCFMAVNNLRRRCGFVFHSYSRQCR